MERRISLIEIEQPIGTFYIGKIKSGDLFRIARVETRESGKGVQREESQGRIKNIAKYCDDPDATFPTPIILAVDTKDVISVRSYSELQNEGIGMIESLVILTYDDKTKFAEVLDGQHRLKGIEAARIENLDLPVVFMFDMTEEEKAYVFSTINSNQTKVPKSLIYDLFELSEKPSPHKTCHEIARILNSDEKSPFFGRLKMLGKKTGENAVLSQGSFVFYLTKLISDNPEQDMILFKKGKRPKENSKLPFREYFLAERDDIILKIVQMFFSAVNTVFPEEWTGGNYILAKTTGYAAMIMVLGKLYERAIESGQLSEAYFEHYLRQGKRRLEENGLTLTSECFSSNAQNQSKLANFFLDEIK